MTFSIELKVPAEASFASLVEHVVADAAHRGELTQRECTAILGAARLGFEAIVEEAMAEAREPLRVAVACTPLRLCVAIFERGLPMSDEQAHRDPRFAAIAAEIDEVHWHAHGRAGSELRLIVNRSHGIPAPGQSPPLERAEGNVALAPEQEYVIRRFEPGDAPGIARAFYLTYGYHYDLPAVYVPERLTELNAQGRYISIVAVAENGEIAGHYALAREGDDPIADAGGAVVLPVHRGRNLLNRLRRAAEEVAAAMGLAAYYSEPVTDHGRTQHASESFGAKACGITLGLSPTNFLAKHMELSTTNQRQSFMLYVRPLRPRDRRVVYAPQRHRATIERIYDQLGLPVDVRDGTTTSERGALRSGIVRADAIGTLAIDRAGSDSAELARQAVADLRSVRHLGALYAWLPLDDPGTPALSEALEREGFFFSGVGPWMLDGRDALRLQMPLTPIDLSALTVIGAFGKELLAYIGAERDRVAHMPKE